MAAENPHRQERCGLAFRGVRPSGFEPLASSSGGMRSIQLSYGRAVEREANKPSSVSVAGGGSFLWDADRSTPRCSLPGTLGLLQRRGPAPRPLFGLAPGGVYRAASCCQSRGGLLHHRFTLACARRPSAVCSLLHCPSPCDARLLAGTLPCELGLSSTGAGPAAIRTRFPFCQTARQCARQDSNLKPLDP